MVRHDARVADLRVHTKNYPDDARERLGLAVVRAREAAGHPYRPSFAAQAGISVRSLLKLETGQPVGATVYEAAARALPGWIVDTPTAILAGGPVPPVVHVTPGQDPVEAEVFEQPPSEIGSDEWLEWYRQRLLPEHFSEVFRITMQLRAKVSEVDEIRRMLAESVRPT